MIQIKQITEITEDTIEAFARLIPQLASECKLLTREELEQIINSPDIFLFVACNPHIVGSLTLIVNRMPTGVKAWIEDVVVDSAARKQSIGEKLVRHAVDVAISMHIKSINLTSTPSRVAANELYKKIGFEKRETNVYRLTVD